MTFVGRSTEDGIHGTVVSRAVEAEALVMCGGCRGLGAGVGVVCRRYRCG